MRTPLAALAALLPLAACGSTTEQPVATAPITESGQDLGRITATPVAGWDTYGGDVSDAAPLTVAEVTADPAAHGGEVVVVEGTVGAVCQKMGCWMNLEGSEPPVRVIFQDHVYFVPFEAAGSTARVEGVLTVETVDVETQQHFLEESGDLEAAAAVTEPRTEVTIVAAGVRMKRD